MSKGSQTVSQQTSNTTTPPAYLNTAYQSLLGRAQDVSQTPFAPYVGESIAPFTPEQNLALSNINQGAGFAAPYIWGAGNLAAGAAQPLTGQQIAYYMDPYLNTVAGSTLDWLKQLNASQQQQVLGNAVAQGALGGNRVGLTQAALAGQQAYGEAPTFANIYNQGYGQAVQLAQQQFQQNPQAVAALLANIGLTGQQGALQGAGAQLGVGGQQQQTQQAQDYFNVQQYYMAQGYPFQTAQWLAGLETGLGGVAGGTSTGTATTTGPAPSGLAQGVGALGTVLGGAGLFMSGYKGGGQKDGGAVKGYQTGGMPGGSPLAYDPSAAYYSSILGSTPYGGMARSYVPMATRGGQGLGLPRPGSAAPPPAEFERMISGGQGGGGDSLSSMTGLMKGMGGLGKGLGTGTTPAYGDPSEGAGAATAMDLPGGTLGIGGGGELAGLTGADVTFLDPSLMLGDFAGAAGADALAGVGADLGVGAAADLGAAGGADLLAMLPFLLVQSGGRINYPGGMSLPIGNRIKMPMRGGLGMPSFVRGVPHKGYADGGDPTFDDRFYGIGPGPTAESVAEQYMKNQEAIQGYGLGSTPSLPTPDDTDVSTFRNQAEPNWKRVGLLAPPTAEQLADDETPLRKMEMRQTSDGLPPEITAGTSRPGVGGPYTGPHALGFAPDVGLPAATDGYQRPPWWPTPIQRPQTTPGPQPGFLGLSPDFYMSLLLGSARLMGARPGESFGQALGAGVGEGAKTYMGLKGGEASVEMESQKLDRQAQQEADRIKHETETLEETRKFHEATIAHQKEQLAQENWTQFTDQFGRPWLYNKKSGETKPASVTGGVPASPVPSAPSPPWGTTVPVPYSPATPMMQAGGVPPDDQQAAPSWLSSVGAAEASPKAQYVPVPSSGPGPTVMLRQQRDEAAEPLTQKLRLDSSEMAQDDPPGAHPEVLDRLRAEGMDEGAVQRVRAIGQGRMNFLPSGMRNPLNQAIMNAAFEYNPQLGQNDYQNRLRTSNFFAVGTQGGGGQNIAAMNTWAQHVNDYLGLMKKLDLGDYTSLNEARNALARRGFSNKQTQDIIYQVEAAQKAAADEGAKVFAGTGSALGDREEWIRRLPINVPFHTSLAVVKELEGLVQGRLTALTHMYNEGMHTGYGNHDFMSPRTRQVIESIEGADDPEKYTPLPHYKLQSSGASTGVARVDPRDADFLRANPNAASAIDRKYGAGTAERLMGQ